MKGILEFNLPEEKEDFETAQKGWKYKSMYEEVWDKVFRPYHKHGYGEEIDKLLEKKECKKLFEELESRYRQIRIDFED
jgi:uncharacterized lipoprotein YehR (DUF1307 family)